MSAHKQSHGFTLVEVLLVLAIIGIISGIAIPSYMGQRRRARIIGDAQANAQVLRMQLEARKSENGIYGTGSCTWTAAGSVLPASNNLIPGFTPKGNSKMDYNVAIGSTGLTYILTVKDPSISGSPIAFQTDQTGQVLKKME